MTRRLVPRVKGVDWLVVMEVGVVGLRTKTLLALTVKSAVVGPLKQPTQVARTTAVPPDGPAVTVKLDVPGATTPV